MKVPKQIKYWKSDNTDMITEVVELRPVTPCERQYNVRGYRVDKLGLQEPIFVRKWSTAVLVYCFGIYKSPGKFSGRGGRIEAVR